MLVALCVDISGLNLSDAEYASQCHTLALADKASNTEVWACAFQAGVFLIVTARQTVSLWVPQ